MAASRQKLYRKFRGLEEEVDRLFDQVLASTSYFTMLTENVWRPPTDVFETEDAVLVCMEIPGVNRDEVEVTLDGNALTIRGHRQDRCSETKVCVHRMEINYGHFHRRITLPSPLEEDSIPDCRLVSGFLRIRVPKPKANSP